MKIENRNYLEKFFNNIKDSRNKKIIIFNSFEDKKMEIRTDNVNDLEKEIKKFCSNVFHNELIIKKIKIEGDSILIEVVPYIFSA